MDTSRIQLDLDVSYPDERFYNVEILEQELNNSTIFDPDQAPQDVQTFLQLRLKIIDNKELELEEPFTGRIYLFTGGDYNELFEFQLTEASRQNKRGTRQLQTLFEAVGLPWDDPLANLDKLEGATVRVKTRHTKNPEGIVTGYTANTFSWKPYDPNEAIELPEDENPGW